MSSKVLDLACSRNSSLLICPSCSRRSSTIFSFWTSSISARILPLWRAVMVLLATSLTNGVLYPLLAAPSRLGLCVEVMELPLRGDETISAAGFCSQVGLSPWPLMFEACGCLGLSAGVSVFPLAVRTDFFATADGVTTDVCLAAGARRGSAAAFPREGLDGSRGFSMGCGGYGVLFRASRTAISPASCATSMGVSAVLFLAAGSAPYDINNLTSLTLPALAAQ
mmetsp:Transcript_21088/g.37751  ORF Transcript_21088/g.37751 Transcript_21088/m.37751 type:complete len:224 (+) Transcript_21088:3409-4080(+)